MFVGNSPLYKGPALSVLDVPVQKTICYADFDQAYALFREEKLLVLLSSQNESECSIYIDCHFCCNM
jgi:hypothetical protein